MFKRAYVEITNLCSLQCSFCPGTRRRKRLMPAGEFRLLAGRLRPHVKYLYLHVMGEPLLHPELGDLLSIAGELGFRVCLTTNGTLLGERTELLLSAPALHKVSVSLHSAEGNGMGELAGYLAAVWDYVLPASRAGTICVLRLWNAGGAEARNGEILAFLADRLGAPPLDQPQPRPGSWRLRERLYLERAEKFDWPDLSAPEADTRFCLGLRDQVAVLCDGTVVPCCLDGEGECPLGNLLREELADILARPLPEEMAQGFRERRITQQLCRRCGYRTRFGTGDE